MKRKDLYNQTEGAYLRKNYLEAFVIQSAYIESLLRSLIDDKLHFHLPGNICKRCAFMGAVRKRLVGTPLNSLIQLLHEGKYIDSEQRKNLITYKDKRNAILHGLLEHISSPNFEKELAEAYEAGKEVLKHWQLKCLEEVIDAQEDGTVVDGSIPLSGVDDPGVINRFSHKGYGSFIGPKGKTYQVQYVIGPKSWIPRVQSTLKPNYAAHFWNENQLIVVFAEKVFELDRTDKSTWVEAISYAESIGVPKEHLRLDFK